MSAVPQAAASSIWDAPYTEEERQALWESVLWFHDQRSAGNMVRYAKQFVAILGDRVLAADPDKDGLCRRIEALGDSIPQRRVLVQYVPGPGDHY